MQKISVEAIKELRNVSSASISDCKKALADAEGDMKKAMDLLRKRGLEKAASKADRGSKEGRVEAYVHLGNKIGVLLEVGTDTDFVAKNELFCQFTKDLAMQIAACSPLYVSRDDVPADLLKGDADKEKELYYKTHCLLDQPFVKDPGITINDYLGNLVAKFNEKIVIRKFIRYKIGE
jgi:elongation factor Ts